MDFGITMTPERPVPTHTNPHPAELEDELAVKGVRFFMMESFKLFNKMFSVDKSVPHEADVARYGERG